MSKYTVQKKTTSLTVLFIIMMSITVLGQNDSKTDVGTLSTSGKVLLVKSGATWGIVIDHPGGASVDQPQPVKIKYYITEMKNKEHSSGYATFDKTANGFIGKGQLAPMNGVTIVVTDEWTIADNALNLKRQLTVSGNGEGGFYSKIGFTTHENNTFPDVDLFMPGIIYGRSENQPISPGYLYSDAPASKKHYDEGSVEEREDAFPIPVAGISFKDGTSIAAFDNKPDGATISDDTQDEKGLTLIDERMKFGAFGFLQNGTKVDLSFWFPGSKGNRPRFHPFKNTLTQAYGLSFRFSRNESFHEFYRNTWRWAWASLNPAFNHYDIEVVKKSLASHLAGLVLRSEDRTGIPFWTSMLTGENFGDAGLRDRDAIMGFVGKNLEGAALLLQVSYEDNSPENKKYRQTALDIINTFVKYVKVSPPSGTGFNIETGEPSMTNPAPNHVPCCNGRLYLREFTDDMRWVLKAYQWELAKGTPHYNWFRWCADFGEWLLKNEDNDGRFPRSWYPGTGVVYDASFANSYNVMAFLTKLGEVSKRQVFWTAEGIDPFVSAAKRAGDFIWKEYESQELYIGGTLDNNNILDKEASTLSLEGYLALYETTKETKWLDRAKAAADFAETWIYAWNVPMPMDETNATLQWKKGVSTIGVTKISSHGSGVDQWMSGDVDEFAKLWKYTNDPHFKDIARIELHNAKNMLALPGRLYDYYEPGAQQEHWGMGNSRGHARHQGALPWVTVNHLTGIMALKEFDTDLYKELSAEKK